VEPDSSLGLTGFVEDFASSLVAGGVPRMPARVFSRLLVSESGRLTAAELAGLLKASPAAISGAVRYLDAVGLLRRTREPGSRRDQYVVEHDVWYQASVTQDQLLDRWIGQLDVGITLVGEDTQAGARLAETREFFAFLRDEMTGVLARWETRRQTASAS
jgi:DNA-binding transcriptional regulator GbsR (MarR family)